MPGNPTIILGNMPGTGAGSAVTLLDIFQTGKIKE